MNASDLEIDMSDQVDLDDNENKCNQGLARYEKSQYYQCFKTSCEKLEIDVDGKPNEFYSEVFLSYLMKVMVPYAPMWSSIISNYSTNATVENFFGFLKNTWFNGELHQKPGRFFESTRLYIDAKLKQIKYDIREKLPSKENKNDFINLEEKWSSRSKKINHYLPKSKYITAKLTQTDAKTENGSENAALTDSLEIYKTDLADQTVI